MYSVFLSSSPLLQNSRLNWSFKVLLSRMCLYIPKLIHKLLPLLEAVWAMSVHVLITVYHKNKLSDLPSVFINFLSVSWHPWNMYHIYPAISWPPPTSQQQFCHRTLFWWNVHLVTILCFYSLHIGSRNTLFPGCHTIIHLFGIPENWFKTGITCNPWEWRKLCIKSLSYFHIVFQSHVMI